MLRKWAVLIVGAGLLLPPLNAAAQAPNFSSSIEHGQVLSLSPFEFTVSYPAPIRINAIALTDQDGVVTTLDASPARSLSRTQAIELPVLKPHRYRLAWTAADASGRPIQGQVSFELRGCEENERTPKRP